MKESVNVRGNPPPVQLAPAARPERPVMDDGPQILVRYYHRMRLQRTYPFTVEWQTAEKGTPAVQVRPLIPGALVTPQELTLDSQTPGAQVVFHVTPLALGKIRAARVEIIPPQGERVDITLTVKMVRQRLTWILFLLTFLLPALLLVATSKATRLSGYLPRRAAGEMPGPPRLGPPLAEPLKKGVKPKEPPKQAENRLVRADAGEMLAYFIKKNIPDIPPFSESVADGLGVAYQFLCTLTDQDPVAFYLGLGLLLLTGVSWLTHLAARGRRRSKPLRFAGQVPAKPAPPSELGPADDVVMAKLVDAGEGK